ncbi:paraneoplastic antigen Ma6E-like [Rhinolophus ferrumequinum]|uniref:paraneoplastic antigen Ma6E-like n=1 Tax=Rhinolophus ferrumequinum TaxID=59479 RepID=UPI00140F8F1C|nr:paraneoplastic antigen Ma6E-like [Rhinolophus ferrumequinum]
MALTMLRDRCGWMGTNAQLSLLILGIPDDCENRQFQEAVQAACGPWAGAPGEAEAWIQQWNQALQPVLENVADPELRTFSGTQEPGSEEEPFESWLDHANDVLYQWRHISERERRRRLVESLGGPALNLMCGLLDENPHMTAHECLVALVQVFGNKDTRTAARMKFMTCTQQPQETLFAYVMHLEGLLQTAMEKRAIHPTLADQVRTRQVLMWAHPNKTLQSKLRRMGLERRPPGFMGMLRLVRETETWEAILAGIHHFQMEEDALACIRHLATAHAAPSCADAAQAATASADAAQATSDNEHATQAIPASADAAQAASDNEHATQAIPASADAAEGTSDNEHATQAIPASADAAEGTSDHEDATQAIPASADAAQATSDNEHATQAIPDSADAAQATSDNEHATQAIPASHPGQ